MHYFFLLSHADEKDAHKMHSTTRPFKLSNVLKNLFSCYGSDKYWQPPGASSSCQLIVHNMYKALCISSTLFQQWTMLLELRNRKLILNKCIPYLKEAAL